MIKKFLINLFVFLFIAFIIVGSYLLLIYFHPALVDETYYKFTTPRSNSLIIGTSRSAVGIIPSILNNKLFNGEKKIINHSFTFGTSNYGPRYLRQIKQKIEPNRYHNGLFIISVDPWALSINQNDSDDTSSFIEIKNNVFVGGLKSSSVNPNFEYLLKYWGNRINPLILLTKQFTKHDGTWILQSDGYMEINVPCDPVSVKHRLEQGLNDYKNNHMKLSETRFNYLEQIIKFLKTEGTIYLVRLPITDEMKNLEFRNYPNFDDKISAIAKNNNVKYFNFINSDNYKFVDVHHLQKQSASILSNQLCDSILNLHKLAVN